MPATEFLVERQDGGKTITWLLRARFKLTWAQAKRLVENGHIRVAGFATSDLALRVRKGNRVWIREGTVEIPKVPGAPKEPKKADEKAKKLAAAKVGPSKPPRPKDAVDESITRSPWLAKLQDAIVYSDDAIVVVNKPSGLTTMRHKSEAEEFGARGKTYLPKTLADLLPVLLGAPNSRVIAVHRIDRDTSGLVIFARKKLAAEHLMQQFRKHNADRKYLALVRGTPLEGRRESTFVSDRGDGRRGTSTNPEAEGKRASTHVKLLERYLGFALVECRLETGRTHQVRIHLAEGGSPLCGETVYDRSIHGRPKPDASGAARPMLHAAILGVSHPTTGEVLKWDVPPPADFTALLATLRTKV